MAITREDPRAQYFVGPLREEHMKTHVKRDVLERVLILYEAPAGTQDGGPCLATVYAYTGSNTVPTASLEKMGIWNGDWDDVVDAELIYGDVGYVE
jgi:hypothetical protein